MITLADVRKYLDDNKIEGDWDDDRVSAVLAVEHGAQRSVLNIPSPRPAEVDDALLRRVAHNLTTSTSGPVERIGVQGDGVRDLERPWSKRRSPGPAAQPAADEGPRGNTAVKKTAAKKAATTTEKEKS